MQIQSDTYVYSSNPHNPPFFFASTACSVEVNINTCPGLSKHCIWLDHLSVIRSFMLSGSQSIGLNYYCMQLHETTQHETTRALDHLSVIRSLVLSLQSPHIQVKWVTFYMVMRVTTSGSKSGLTRFVTF